VDDLIKEIKRTSSPALDNVDVDFINLRKHGVYENLSPELKVDVSFENSSHTPLQIIIDQPSNKPLRRNY